MRRRRIAVFVDEIAQDSALVQTTIGCAGMQCALFRENSDGPVRGKHTIVQADASIGVARKDKTGAFPLRGFYRRQVLSML